LKSDFSGGEDRVSISTEDLMDRVWPLIRIVSLQQEEKQEEKFPGEILALTDVAVEILMTKKNKPLANRIISLLPI
jgi:hypothetical protein|tara:strand:- start:286 stop:513 length:228 start_codon:yes stop_codon:yes gene_type:complete